MTKQSKSKQTHEKELLALYTDVKAMSIANISGKFRISYQEAEDIYQTAFLKAFKKINKFKGQSSVKTWFYRIIQNASLDHIRRPYVKREREFLRLGGEEDEFVKEFKDTSPNPSQVFENKDNTKDLKNKITIIFEKLTSNHKRVLDLLYLQGCSYETTAKKMRCSVGTIMSRAFYARKHFVKLFQNLEAKSLNKVH